MFKFEYLYYMDVLDDGITALKNSRAPGLNDIQTELIKHIGHEIGNCVSSTTAPSVRTFLCSGDKPR